MAKRKGVAGTLDAFLVRAESLLSHEIERRLSLDPAALQARLSLGGLPTASPLCPSLEKSPQYEAPPDVTGSPLPSLTAHEDGHVVVSSPGNRTRVTRSHKNSVMKQKTPKLVKRKKSARTNTAVTTVPR